MESLKVVYPDKTYTLPDLAPKSRKLECAEVNALLGTQYQISQIIGFLQKMRFGAMAEGDEIHVQIPAYRNDIIHNVDIIEDIAIGAGYENIVSVLPRKLTFGREMEIETFSNRVRQITLGYGYSEVKCLTLSSESDQYDMMQRSEDQNVVKILNPISEDMTCARVSLVPSMFRILQANKHRDLPQTIFEVGDVVHGEDTIRHLAALTIHPKASFTEVKSLMQSVMRDLDILYKLGQTDDGAYIQGRAAEIIVNESSVGSFGEYDPKVIENFGLGYSVAGFEISLASL
jgi:phenylalanyl-tRNA synthetase beta chain